MQSMTLEQLRAAVGAGGVVGVTLRGQGSGFFVEIATRSGQETVLAKARSSEPRRFGNPASALLVLRDVGIAVARLDATAWDPASKDMRRSRGSQAEALRAVHRAAAHARQLAADIEASLADARPNLSHDDVMAEMEADIAALAARRD